MIRNLETLELKADESFRDGAGEVAVQQEGHLEEQPCHQISTP